MFSGVFYYNIMKATSFKFYLIFGAILLNSFENLYLTYLRIILQKHFQRPKIIFFKWTPVKKPYYHISMEKREFTIIIKYLGLHWFLAASNSFIIVFKLL